MKNLFVFIILNVGIFSIAAQNAHVDSLQKRIEQLEEVLNKENFTSVPNKEFEKTLEITVKDEIENWVSAKKVTIITMWGILSFLFGFLLKYYFTENYRKKIDDKVEDQTNALNKKTSAFITETAARMNEFMNTINTKITYFTEDFKLKADTTDNRIIKLEEGIKAIQADQNKFFDQTIALIENKINSTLGFIWDDIVDDNIRKATEKEFKGDDVIYSLKKLLEAKDIKLSDLKKIELIDALIRCYYFKKAESEGKMGDVMISLIEKYENTLALKPETFANVALKSCNYYEYYGNSKFREATHLYCHKSIDMLPDYGIPYAVLLEMYLIDKRKAKSDQERLAAENNIAGTFKNISNNQSVVLAYEIMHRIFIDESTYLKDYIHELFKDYVPHLDEINGRASNYMLSNASILLKREKDKELLEKILNVGLQHRPFNLDGTWLLSDEMNAGIKTNLKGIEEKMAIQAYQLSFITAVKTESALLYVLKNDTTWTMKLYYAEPFEEVECIYKFENETLTLCIASKGNTPNDFVSDQQNKNLIRMYKKLAVT